MNIDEAYKILGVDKSISDADLKTKYRELAFKYHPDRYTGEEANKLSQINEANTLIKDHRENPQKYQQPDFFGGQDFINIQDLFGQNPFGFGGGQTVRNISPPHLNVSVSFKEAILGENKEISYKRNIKCEPCNGEGFEKITNNCDKCNGFGTVVINSGRAIFSQQCGKCFGRNVKKISCNKCNGNCTITSDINGTVHIPAGTIDGSTLAVRGKGHFMGGGMFGETYTDLFIHVKVNKKIGLELIGNDVVSNINISLLEALKGTTKEVETIFGSKNIVIPSSSKNRDEISIPNCGVKTRNGTQRVIININYPLNSDKLIEFLSSENN